MTETIGGEKPHRSQWVLGELLVFGLGPAEASEPTKTKILEQKNHLLEKERGGG